MIMMVLSPEMFERYTDEVMKETKRAPGNGQLRVLHFPQIPCKPFEVWTRTIEDAEAILKVLAQYDLFLLAENHRGDFSNAQSIQVWDDECPDDEGSCWIDLDEDEQAEVAKCGGYEKYKSSKG